MERLRKESSAPRQCGHKRTNRGGREELEGILRGGAHCKESPGEAADPVRWGKGKGGACPRTQKRHFTSNRTCKNEVPKSQAKGADYGGRGAPLDTRGDVLGCPHSEDREKKCVHVKERTGKGEGRSFGGGNSSAENLMCSERRSERFSVRSSTREGGYAEEWRGM